MDDKIFYYALAGSFLLHLNLAAVLLFSNAFIFKKQFKPIHVSYRAQPLISAGKRREAQSVLPQAVLNERKLSSPAEILPKGDSSMSPLVKELTKPASKLKTDSEHGKLALTQTQRKVSIPVFKSEKITNPKYLHYTQTIREKIKARAWSYLDSPEFVTGEVYLTFIVSANGELKDVLVIDEKTTANPYLRSVGLRSIKESSPFPAFPADLMYPELTFSVAIAFEE